MIVGHEETQRRLWASAARGGLHHALLFEGPQGVGKRAVALRLAMAVNCTGAALADGPDACPCDRCPTCRGIAAATHPDVVVLEPAEDSASRTIPVDAVREVIRRVGYHRYGARMRMVIVDPAEALQPAAANALLKTLEEPPDGTGFVLLAGSATALLPTIVSRCQRVRFGPVPEPALVAWLTARGIDDAEGVARAAEGAPGRALALADGGLAERRGLRDRLLDALAGDLGAILKLSQELAEGKKGGRVALALDTLEELVRDAAVAGAGSSLPRIHPERADVTDAWARATWPTGLTGLADAVTRCRDGLAVNVNARLALDALLATFATELGAARKAGAGLAVAAPVTRAKPRSRA